MCCGDNKNSDKKACQCAGHESAEKLSAVWFSSTQTRLRLTRGRFDLCSTFQDASRTYATTLRRSTTQTSVFPAVSPLHVEVANRLQLRVILTFFCMHKQTTATITIAWFVCTKIHQKCTSVEGSTFEVCIAAYAPVVALNVFPVSLEAATIVTIRNLSSGTNANSVLLFMALKYFVPMSAAQDLS